MNLIINFVQSLLIPSFYLWTNLLQQFKPQLAMWTIKQYHTINSNTGYMLVEAWYYKKAWSNKMSTCTRSTPSAVKCRVHPHTSKLKKKHWLSLSMSQFHSSELRLTILFFVTYMLDHLYSSSTQMYSNNEEVCANIGIIVLKE